MTEEESLIWHATMEGYDSKQNVESNWSYRDLLEMIYVEDFKAIQTHKAHKKVEEQHELEEALKRGRNH